MKLVLLLFIGIALMGYNIKPCMAQQKITVGFQDAGLIQVFEQIEANSQYKFLYNNRDLQDSPRFSLDFKQATIQEILKKILGRTLSFKILDNNLIAIIPVSEKTTDLIDLTGHITDLNGESLSGVSIYIQGKNKGTLTNDSGYFHLQTEPGSTLLISYLGYEEKKIKIGDNHTVQIALTKKLSELKELVVTALGITKAYKTVGYAIQQLDVAGTVIEKSREANIFTALYGKIAGLGIENSSYMYNNPGIYLRGEHPLIVVDGVPNHSDSWDLNADDIATITVLKGPAAAALYGQQGSNGAIQITTRRGSMIKRPFAVSFNSTTEIQDGFLAIPEAQHHYGPGDYFKYAFVDGKGGGVYDYDYNVWGPRYEGQLITQWDSPRDNSGKLIPLPWISRNNNNLEDFLRNGLLSTNNIALMGKNENGDFRVSLTQLYHKGIIPNTHLNITTVNLSGSLKLGPHLHTDAVISYNKQYTPNFPSVTYGPESPIYELLIWNGSNFDINDPKLRNYWQPGKEGLQQRWVEYYQYNNPWFNAYEYLKAYYKNVLTGYVSLSWLLNKSFNIEVKSAINTYTINQNNKYPVSGSYYGDDFNKVGAYSELNDYYFQNNTSARLNFHPEINEKFSLKFTLGANLETVQTKHFSAHTTGGLIIPGLYTLQNSAKPIDNATTTKSLTQIASLYSFIDLGYKNFLFLDLSGRMDRNSNLPIENTTYFYPQASVSAVLSDAFSLPESISFFKLNASFAKVGEGMSPYSLQQTYSAGTTWQGYPSVYYSDNNTLYDRHIKPEFHSAYEAGVDIRFLKGRIGLRSQWYVMDEGPQIFPLSISNSSGYGYKQVNGRVIQKRGAEFILTGSPIDNKNFKWNMIINWSTYKRYLKKVYDSLDHYQRIKVGQRYDQLFINAFERDPKNGAILYHTDGTPIINDQYPSFFGYIYPDWNAGTTQYFSYKDWGLTIALDGSYGGKIFNYVNYKMWQSGTHIASDNEYRYQDWLHRDDPDYKGTRIGKGEIVTGGSVIRDQDGHIISDTRKFAPNTTSVLEEDWANTYETADERNYQSKTYFKIRGITLTYNFSESFIKRTGLFYSGSVSLIARNVLYLAHTQQIDLDRWTFSKESNLESPSVRSMGININMTF